MTLTEKVAYLKGLITGLEIDQTTKESKIIHAMVDILEEMALTVSDLEDNQEELQELASVIDKDLGSLEDDFYDFDEEDDDEDFEDEEFYEVTCPNCADIICLDEDTLLEGEIACPNCKELLEFDFDELEHDHDCDCGCHSHAADEKAE